jgi:hypothetical protein
VKIVQIDGQNFIEHNMKQWAKEHGYTAEVEVKGKTVVFNLAEGFVKDIDGIHPIEIYRDNYITDKKGNLDYIMKYQAGIVLERIRD